MDMTCRYRQWKKCKSEPPGIYLMMLGNFPKNENQIKAKSSWWNSMLTGSMWVTLSGGKD